MFVYYFPSFFFSHWAVSPSSPRPSGRDSPDILLLLLIIRESIPVFTMKDGAGCKFFSGTLVGLRECLSAPAFAECFMKEPLIVENVYMSMGVIICPRFYCCDMFYRVASDVEPTLLFWSKIPFAVMSPPFFYFWFGGYCINIHSGGWPTAYFSYDVSVGIKVSKHGRSAHVVRNIPRGRLWGLCVHTRVCTSTSVRWWERMLVGWSVSQRVNK